MDAMQVVLNDIEKDSTIRFRPVRRMSDEGFYAFCAANPDFRIERTAKGEIVIMPPTGGETSHQNAGLKAQLYNWASREGRGKDLDSNVEYIPGVVRQTGCRGCRPRCATGWKDFACDITGALRRCQEGLGATGSAQTESSGHRGTFA
jgi:hypothetical protein